MCLVTGGKWAVRATTMNVWKVGSGGGVVVVSRKGSVLTNRLDEASETHVSMTFGSLERDHTLSLFFYE